MESAERRLGWFRLRNMGIRSSVLRGSVQVVSAVAGSAGGHAGGHAGIGCSAIRRGGTKGTHKFMGGPQFYILLCPLCSPSEQTYSQEATMMTKQRTFKTNTKPPSSANIETDPEGFARLAAWAQQEIGPDTRSSANEADQPEGSSAPGSSPTG